MNKRNATCGRIQTSNVPNQVVLLFIFYFVSCLAGLLKCFEEKWRITVLETIKYVCFAEVDGPFHRKRDVVCVEICLGLVFACDVSIQLWCTIFIKWAHTFYVPVGQLTIATDDNHAFLFPLDKSGKVHLENSRCGFLKFKLQLYVIFLLGTTFAYNCLM